MHISDFSGWKPTNTYLSIDLGKVMDYTALTVLDEFEWCEVTKSITHPEVVTSLVPQPTGKVKYELTGLKRFERGTSYPKQVAGVTSIFKGLKSTVGPPVTLVLDATGVGSAVADLFRTGGLHPVEISITGGEKASSRPWGFNVPKGELISAIQRVIGTAELKISAELPLAGVLVEEATRMEAKQSPTTGNVTFRHRDGEHDDLVLALAQAVWLARHRRRGKLRTMTKGQLGL